MKYALIFLILIVAVPSNAEDVRDENHKWADSYEQFKMHIRFLDGDARNKCEILLLDILKGIDEATYCKDNDECTLIDHLPFGPSVPIRMDTSKTMRNMMSDFNESCSNDRSISIKSNELINEPICWKNKCMVQTSTK